MMKTPSANAPHPMDADTEEVASYRDVELAAAQDVGEDFLSEDDLAYYLELSNL